MADAGFEKKEGARQCEFVKVTNFGQSFTFKKVDFSEGGGVEGRPPPPCPSRSKSASDKIVK